MLLKSFLPQYQRIKFAYTNEKIQPKTIITPKIGCTSTLKLLKIPAVRVASVSTKMYASRPYCWHNCGARALFCSVYVGFWQMITTAKITVVMTQLWHTTPHVLLHPSERIIRTLHIKFARDIVIMIIWFSAHLPPPREMFYGIFEM